jgi:cytochrome b561
MAPLGRGRDPGGDALSPVLAPAASAAAAAAGVPPLVAALAPATHRSLDAILIATPLAGYISAAAAGHRVSLFGLVSLPPLLPENLRLSQAAMPIHLGGQYLFYFFALLHIWGALYHATVRQDGVVERMLPFWPAAVRAARAITPVRRRAG